MPSELSPIASKPDALNQTHVELTHAPLHPQLAKDSVMVCQLGLSELRLINDARFFWLILVPRRANIAEWFELDAPEQAQLHAETMDIAARLKRHTGCTKVNIGALGNVVRQLHVHIIARTENDACWPRPVWGSAMEAMDDKTLAHRATEVQAWF
jgi:diadenosine tetraphosphate (Ap4A) HIT family hydrolase